VNNSPLDDSCESFGKKSADIRKNIPKSLYLVVLASYVAWLGGDMTDQEEIDRPANQLSGAPDANTFSSSFFDKTIK
jgi:hypothetical protein